MNALQYIRGHERDYDYWSELGNPGWDFESVLKYFKKSEGNQNQSFVEYQHGRYHNANGPLKISAFDGDDPFSQIFIDAAAEQGIPFVDDMNADKHIGYTYMQGFVYNGRRESSAKAFLAPIKDRPNLHVIKHAMVRKIIIDEKNRARGVKFVYKGKYEMKAFASKEVILSAGSLMSPQVLMLSGIGPKKHLRKHKIRVKSDLPVGNNLFDHVYAYLWFSFDPISSRETFASSDIDSLYEFVFHNSGPLNSFAFDNLAGFINLDGNGTIADTQPTGGHFTVNSSSLKSYASMFKPEIRQKLLDENQNRDLIVIYAGLLHPKSNGTVRLNGTNIYGKPIVNTNYFGVSDDLELLLRVVKQQISYVNTTSFRRNGGEFVEIPIKGCTQFGYESDDYLRCYIKHLTGTNYHPVGTSKMGPDSDATAVVDSRLKVRRIKGLRQIDAGM